MNCLAAALSALVVVAQTPDRLISQRLPLGRIAGVILDPEGRPVAGKKVAVSAYSSTEPTLGYHGGYWTWSEAETGAQGEFDLKGVVPGAVHLVAWIPGMLDEYRHYVLVAPGQEVTDLVIRSPGYGGTIGGVVVNERGQPVRDALVSSREEYGDPIRETRNIPETDDRTRSGPDGRFRLTHVAPGEVTVWAYARGWPPASSEEVTVAEGGEATAKLVVRRCNPGTWTLAARVVDEDGRAVAGARADVADEAAGGSSPARRSPAFTSSSLGGLLAYGLPASRAVVMRVFHADHGYWEETLSGREGEYRRATIRLSPAATVSGRLDLGPDRMDQGRGIDVELQREPRDERFWPGLRAMLEPDARGRYRLAGLASGTWKVGLTIDGGRRRATGVVTVPPGRRTVEHDIVVSPGATVEGRVLGPEGRPAEGARVFLTREGEWRGYGPLMAEDGRFRFECIDPAQYGLVVWAPGTWPTVTEVALSEGARWRGVEVRLGEGPTVSGTVVDGEGRPMPGTPILIDPFAAVLAWPDPPAGPVAAYALSAQAGPLASALQYLSGVPITTAGPTGRFTIRGAKVASVALFAGPELRSGWSLGQYRMGRRETAVEPLQPEQRLPDGRYMAVGGVLVSLGDAQSVSDADIRVAKPFEDDQLCSARGRVEDADRQAGAELTVCLWPERWGASGAVLGTEAFRTPDHDATQVKADGSFEIRNVPPGAYHVLVAEEERAWQVAHVTLAEGEGTDLGVLGIPQPGSLEGVVLDAEGDPVTEGEVLAARSDTDMWLSANMSSGRPVQRTPLDSQGRYRLGRLEGGLWFLMAFSPKERASAILKVVIDGGAATLDFRHRYLGRIAGRVTTTDGRPVAGAALRCHGRTLRESLEAKTTEDGRYEVTGLPPGRYGLTLSQWPYFPVQVSQVEVPDTASAVTQDLALEPGGWIEGRLLTADGQPAKNPEFHITAQVGPPWNEDEPRAHVDDDGDIATGLLRPGTYVVRVRLSRSDPTRVVESEPVAVVAGQATSGVVVELATEE